MAFPDGVLIENTNMISLSCRWSKGVKKRRGSSKQCIAARQNRAYEAHTESNKSRPLTSSASYVVESGHELAVSKIPACLHELLQIPDDIYHVLLTDCVCCSACLPDCGTYSTLE